MANESYELTWPAENIDQQILKIPGLEQKIGDLSTLTTEQKANLVAAINELVASVATKTKNSNISASFNITKAYSAGDYTIYEGDLYRAKEDISAGAWDESKWTLISIGEDLAKKANVDGNYEGLTSGYANNLTPMSANDGVIQEAAFISQGTGTGNNFVSVDTSSVAQLLEKSGWTLPIMQLAHELNNTYWEAEVNTTVSFDNNIAILNSSVAGYGLKSKVGTIVIKPNTTYFVAYTAKAENGENVRIRALLGGTYGISVDKQISASYSTQMLVGTTGVNSKGPFFLYPIGDEGINKNIYFKDILLFDITSWPSEIIADLTANPSHFSWYYNGSLAYNPGSLENSTGRYLVCTKRNLWDEQWEVGMINATTGEPQTGSGYIRSKNFMIAIPNRPYYLYLGDRASYVGARLYCYDREKKYLGYTDAQLYNSTTPVITLPNTNYIKFYATGSTYYNDISIELYYSPEQGGEGYDQHYPYEEPFVCDTGDEELLAFDKKAPSGVIENNTAEIDLGNSHWTKYQENGYYVFYSDVKSNAKIARAICSKYTYSDTTSHAALFNDKSFTWFNSSDANVTIRDDSCANMTAAEFKAAMSGVMLQYPLKDASKTTTQSTPYNSNLTVDDYGMMYWLDTDGNLVSIPQPCKVSYNTDYKGSLDTLIKHANGDMTDVALNSEMEEALSNKASIEDVFTHVTITDPATTLGDVKDMLDEINSNGEHVFFDTYALGANTYVCTILIDADNGIYKMFDVVGQRVTEGTYDADKLLVVVLANLDNVASQKQIDNLQEQIDELGGSSLIKDYAVLKQKIADGTSTDAVSPGDKIDINWIDTVTGSTNKGNTVTCSDEWQFAKGVGECEERQYLFVYDGSSWTYNEEQITLSDFGLSVTGTPSVGEVMTITTTVKTVNFTFTGYDKSIPHSSDIHHNWTLEQTYAPDTRIYDTYECLFTLAAGKTLAAGSYKLTNYSHRNGANLTVYFTLSSAVSNTGSSVIQFASLGYVLSGSYYIPSSMRAYQLASDTALTGTIAVSMTEISGATDVSTVDGVVLPGSFDFAVFGNNNWALSNVRQYLNDESKTGTYTPSTNFDRPNAANKGKGWLYGIDPRAYDLIIGVDNKFAAGYGNDGYTQNQMYTSTDKIFLLSMKEMSFNANTAEGEIMNLYGEYTNDTLTNNAVAARAKYNKAGGTLNSYRWSLSAGVISANSDWIVTSSGAYDRNNAYNAYYVAPAFCFGA